MRHLRCGLMSTVILCFLYCCISRRKTRIRVVCDGRIGRNLRLRGEILICIRRRRRMISWNGISLDRRRIDRILRLRIKIL